MLGILCQAGSTKTVVKKKKKSLKKKDSMYPSLNCLCREGLAVTSSQSSEEGERTTQSLQASALESSTFGFGSSAFQLCDLGHVA